MASASSPRPHGQPYGQHVKIDDRVAQPSMPLPKDGMTMWIALIWREGKGWS
ncbi:unnamed protein product [Penicillium camemberti]|uniref:Str. FM013 n=1 Tax=Penicillium camemberti (strain FM 013) TaxID=1429867 RepID=A0A0G4PCX3_PENC3|nr:unnamed protein product [Penicillium camemberti]